MRGLPAVLIHFDKDTTGLEGVSITVGERTSHALFATADPRMNETEKQDGTHYRFEPHA
jgi:hypothetical protein